jgi:hypothetical protein
MARPRVKMNTAGARAILRSSEVRAELRRVGRPVMERMKATAPVDSGEYRDRIEMWDATTDRAVVRIGSTAPHGPLVEARTGNAARALGAEGG